MGDWNARDCGKEGKVVGGHYLGGKNDREDRLKEFCTKYYLVVGNTLFKNHKRSK